MELEEILQTILAFVSGAAIVVAGAQAIDGATKRSLYKYPQKDMYIMKVDPPILPALVFVENPEKDNDLILLNQYLQQIDDRAQRAMEEVRIKDACEWYK